MCKVRWNDGLDLVLYMWGVQHFVDKANGFVGLRKVVRYTTQRDGTRAAVGNKMAVLHKRVDCVLNLLVGRKK